MGDHELLGQSDVATEIAVCARLSARHACDPQSGDLL